MELLDGHLHVDRDPQKYKNGHQISDVDPKMFRQSLNLHKLGTTYLLVPMETKISTSGTVIKPTNGQQISGINPTTCCQLWSPTKRMCSYLLVSIENKIFHFSHYKKK